MTNLPKIQIQILICLFWSYPRLILVDELSPALCNIECAPDVMRNHINFLIENNYITGEHYDYVGSGNKKLLYNCITLTEPTYIFLKNLYDTLFQTK